MGSKVLIGAVVAMVSVWGGVWKLAEPSSHGVALAAPPQERKHAGAQADALEPARTERRRGLRESVASDSVESEALVAPQPLAPAEIARLLADLRDDDIRGNAVEAVGKLCAAGPDVLEPLQGALRSGDWQQRQLAGSVLAMRSDTNATGPLARVLVETLQEYEWSRCATRLYVDCDHLRLYGTVETREIALRRLCVDDALFALAERPVSLGLNLDEPRARIVAAFLLALHRSEIARPRVLRTLIEHLEDNRISGDARLALRGLVHLGSEATPAIESAWPGRDPQQRQLLGHLLSRFSPAHPGAHALRPKELTRLGFPAGDPLQLDATALVP